MSFSFRLGTEWTDPGAGDYVHELADAVEADLTTVPPDNRFVRTSLKVVGPLMPPDRVRIRAILRDYGYEVKE